MDRKQEQVRRHLQGMKHLKSLDERKEIKRRGAERKASHRDEIRQREWSEEDDAADYERQERRTRPEKAPLRPRTEAPLNITHLGLVVGVTVGRARVRTPSGDVDAVLAPEIAKTQKSSLAVGDEVGLTVRADGSFLLVDVHERRSVLSRPDPSRPDVERALAANVDVAVIVAAVVEPALRHRLIDRYLIALARGGIEAIVCANKIDLVEDAAERERIAGVLSDYGAIGVPTIFTSALSAEGLDELRTEIAGKTVVFVGQSGVGKSSLLNAVAPELGLIVGRVREGDGKGRHTTTSSTLFDVPLEHGDARLIDTPGVRSFQLVGMDAASLGACFPEFTELSCRFRDCLHRQEPGCSVVAAVEAEELSAARYDTYRRILASFDE